ncbi:WhiB family transcriptional regulator [Candidatus Saccharibacteria bacterium]|nr:WhiB family transcriptional regulator [Candidatus Saccharibacteria bacterium]
MQRAFCRDGSPDLFFPSDGVGVEFAKGICKECDVVFDCLEYALQNRIEHGVWGGKSERARRQILKRRRQQL